MLKVVVKGGDSFLGTPREVITQMRNGCFHKSSTNLGYKLALATRAFRYYGKHVRWLDDLSFLLDLKEVGEVEYVRFGH